MTEHELEQIEIPGFWPAFEHRHDFLQVENRRWCLCCDLFQSRSSKAAKWAPPTPLGCAFSTPYAQGNQSRNAP